MLMWGMESERLEINKDVSIPLSELDFRTSRASGPGGQNVNRTETQVELLFDVGRSPSLSEAQRARVLHRLRGYVDKKGVLHLTAQSTSSQKRNREEAVERFRTLMDESLHVRKKRVATRPNKGAKETRLRRKRRRSLLKRQRSKVGREE